LLVCVLQQAQNQSIPRREILHHPDKIK